MGWLSILRIISHIVILLTLVVDISTSIDSIHALKHLTTCLEKHFDCQWINTICHCAPVNVVVSSLAGVAASTLVLLWGAHMETVCHDNAIYSNSKDTVTIKLAFGMLAAWIQGDGLDDAAEEWEVALIVNAIVVKD